MTQYQLVFMPYLALGHTRGLRVDAVDIWNFDQEKESIADPAVRERADAILTMYREHGRRTSESARLRGIGVISLGARDCRPFNDTDFRQVHEARHILFLCGLSHNNDLNGPNAGHSMITSDNFDVVSQSFLLDSDRIAETTGTILQLRLIGYSIRETTFTKPPYVNLTSPFAHDELLLAALVDLRGNNPGLFRRIVRASELVLGSYFNSHASDLGARILLQAAAFEALLELPQQQQRRAFKERIEGLVNAPDEKVFQYRYETPGGSRWEQRKRCVMWADRFYTLRNHIIHGHQVSHREYRFLRCQHHFRIGTMMFTHAVKQLINRELKARSAPCCFFERIDWGVIQEGNKWEPREIGYKLAPDWGARMREALSETQGEWPPRVRQR